MSCRCHAWQAGALGTGSLHARSSSTRLVIATKQPFPIRPGTRGTVGDRIWPSKPSWSAWAFPDNTPPANGEDRYGKYRGRWSSAVAGPLNGSVVGLVNEGGQKLSLAVCQKHSSARLRSFAIERRRIAMPSRPVPSARTPGDARRLVASRQKRAHDNRAGGLVARKCGPAIIGSRVPGEPSALSTLSNWP